MIGAVIAVVVAATPITLEEARREGRSNTQALLAALEHERALEQTRLARSGIYPQVALNGTAGGMVNGPQTTFSTVPEVDPQTQNIVGFTQRSVDVLASSNRASFELSVTVSQLLYDGGKWWNRIAQSGAVAEAQAGQAQEQQLASELEAVRRFYELYRAQEAAVVLEANAKRSEQLLERARHLFDAGRAQGVDVSSAQVNLGNDRLELVRQQARITDAQGRLAVWLARPGAQELVATRPELVAPAQAPTLEQALSTAREQRPLLGAVKASLRASELGSQIARGDRWPTIAAQATAGRQGPTADPFFTDPSKQNFVQGGVNLRWDLFTGFGTSARLQEAELVRRRAALELHQAERELEAEVRGALVLFQTQQAAAEIARANVEAATRGLELAGARFDAGAGSTLEVRDAQLKLAQAELTLLQNRVDAEIARAALDRALGQGVTQ